MEDQPRTERTARPRLTLGSIKLINKSPNQALSAYTSSQMKRSWVWSDRWIMTAGAPRYQPLPETTSSIIPYRAGYLEQLLNNPTRVHRRDSCMGIRGMVRAGLSFRRVCFSESRGARCPRIPLLTAAHRLRYTSKHMQKETSPLNLAICSSSFMGRSVEALFCSLILSHRGLSHNRLPGPKCLPVCFGPSDPALMLIYVTSYIRMSNTANRLTSSSVHRRAACVGSGGGGGDSAGVCSTEPCRAPPVLYTSGATVSLVRAFLGNGDRGVKAYRQLDIVLPFVPAVPEQSRYCHQHHR